MLLNYLFCLLWCSPALLSMFCFIFSIFSSILFLPIPIPFIIIFFFLHPTPTMFRCCLPSFPHQTYLNLLNCMNKHWIHFWSVRKNVGKNARLARGQPRRVTSLNMLENWSKQTQILQGQVIKRKGQYYWKKGNLQLGSQSRREMVKPSLSLSKIAGVLNIARLDGSRRAMACDVFWLR